MEGGEGEGMGSGSGQWDGVGLWEEQLRVVREDGIVRLSYKTREPLGQTGPLVPVRSVYENLSETRSGEARAAERSSSDSARAALERLRAEAHDWRSRMEAALREVAAAKEADEAEADAEAEVQRLRLIGLHAQLRQARQARRPAQPRPRDSPSADAEEATAASPASAPSPAAMASETGPERRAAWQAQMEQLRQQTDFFQAETAKAELASRRLREEQEPLVAQLGQRLRQLLQLNGELRQARSQALDAGTPQRLPSEPSVETPSPGSSVSSLPAHSLPTPQQSPQDSSQHQRPDSPGPTNTPIKLVIKNASITFLN